MGFVPADPQFEQRTRASFAKQGAIAVGEVLRSGRTLTVCRLDAIVEKERRRVHCATGVQTLIALAGRGGVKD